MLSRTLQQISLRQRSTRRVAAPLLQLHRPAYTPLTIRFASTTVPDHMPPVRQLIQLANMVDRLRGTNRPSEKQAIVTEYPQLRSLIEFALDPYVRFGITKNSFDKSPFVQLMRTGQWEADYESIWDDTAQTLLQKLADKSISGHAAQAQIQAFMNVFIEYDEEYEEDEYGPGPTVEDCKRAEEAFWMLVERDLKAGFGSKALAKVVWPGSRLTSPTSPGSTETTATSSKFKSISPISSTSASTSTATPSSTSTPPTSTSTTPTSGSKKKYTVTGPEIVAKGLKKFSCALGKSIEAPFKDLNKFTGDWYASRKLDGVRVLALLDFYVPNDTSSPIIYEGAQFVSRAGNPFKSLDKLEEQLVHLARYPELRKILDEDTAVVEEREDGLVRRFVLDGEVCVMVPAGDQPVRISDDGTGATALWENDGLVEDFTDAVSMVKRNATMDKPLYFLFDSLSWAETNAQKALPDEGLGKTFGQRAEVTKAMTEWLRQEIKDKTGEEPKVRALRQWPIRPGDIDGMVERSMNEGWEGLIFRADAPYKGTRSVDVRKFKKLQDAEYTVVGLDISNQRLPVKGVFKFYDAMSNVWIEHKGHRVAVGSGFTPHERIRFAEDPSLIVGKQITVTYFSESESSSRESGTSLRFPRVKVVWTEGKRSI